MSECSSSNMFPTLFLVLLLPRAAFSASLILPSQDNGNLTSGSLIAPTQPDDSSNASIGSNSPIVLESIGDSLSNISFLLPNQNASGTEYDSTFDYPDLDLDATNAEPECKASLGTDLVKTSCIDAVARVSPSDTIFFWGQRGKGSFQAKLPWRSSSCRFFSSHWLNLRFLALV